MNDLLPTVAGFLLTLFIYSYIVGDNPLYRIAVHLLIGVSAAYAAVVVVRTIFVPVFSDILAAPTDPTNLLWLAPLLLSILLLLKFIRPLAWAGNSSVGILVTAGAAVALVGAVSGTLIPQLLQTGSANPVLVLITALLTISVLLYFQFTSRPNQDGEYRAPAWRRMIAGIGQATIMITFGALFAGAFSTSLALLVERVSFYMTELTGVMGLFFP
jgi:hypothetical protein